VNADEWQGFGRKCSWLDFNVLSRHLHVGSEENYENLNHHSRFPGQRFEPGTSQIISRVVNHSTATFGPHYLKILLIQSGKSVILFSLLFENFT
jgi:hypothetical protein